MIPKRWSVVVNRDARDVTIIDPATDKVVKQIPLGTSTNAHMAMPSHDGKKILISATGRDRFLVVDLMTGKVEHSVKTGKGTGTFRCDAGRSVDVRRQHGRFDGFCH